MKIGSLQLAAKMLMASSAFAFCWLNALNGSLHNVISNPRIAAGESGDLEEQWFGNFHIQVSQTSLFVLERPLEQAENFLNEPSPEMEEELVEEVL